MVPMTNWAAASRNPARDFVLDFSNSIAAQAFDKNLASEGAKSFQALVCRERVGAVFCGERFHLTQMARCQLEEGDIQMVTS